MNIQQNLNALLTMGAVAARTSGRYKTQTQINELKREEKQQLKYGGAIQKEMMSGKTPTNLKEATAEGIKNKYLMGLQNENTANLTETQKELAKLKPNIKNIQQTVASQTVRDAQQKTAQQYNEQLDVVINSLKNETNTKVSQKEELANRIERLKNDYGFEVNGGIN